MVAYLSIVLDADLLYPWPSAFIQGSYVGYAVEPEYYDLQLVETGSLEGLKLAYAIGVCIG